MLLRTGRERAADAPPLAPDGSLPPPRSLPRLPTVTSYDYDAPLSEGGEHGFGSDGVDKFAALAAVLRKHTPASEPLPPPEPPLRRRVAFGHVAMHQSAAFLSNAMRMAPTAAASAQPEPPTGVESLGCCDAAWLEPPQRTRGCVYVGWRSGAGRLFCMATVESAELRAQRCRKVVLHCHGR
jgi:hypothetical protein